MTQIGTSVGTLVDLGNLATPINEPNIVPKPYQDSIRLGSGAKKGQGFPSQTWTWNELTNEQRAQLRVFCAAESTDIVIETVDPEDDTGTKQYSGKMHWPDEEDPQTIYRIGFIITFTNLVEITP